MVRINNLYSKALIQLLTVFLFFTFACEREPSEIGLDFKAHEKLNIFSNDTISIEAFTYSLDSVRSDQPFYSLTGRIEDLVFGRSEASFTTQVRLYMELDPGSAPIVDSVFLWLLPDSNYVYGDLNTMLNIKVYELYKRLYPDSIYYSNLDLSDSISLDSVGSQTYYPTDSIVKVVLSNALGQKILSDTNALKEQDKFLNHFKGFYIDANEIVSGNGAISSFNLLDNRSRLEIYFRDASDSLKFEFVISENTARLNLFKHDISTADPSYMISHLDDGIQDTVIYLQGMAGTYAKIRLPYLDAWTDSMPIAVNKAEFIIPLSDDDPEGDNAPVFPDRYDMMFLNDQGKFEHVYDKYYSATYFGGELGEDDEFVRFNVTSHIQDYFEALSQGDTSSSARKKEFYFMVRTPSLISKRGIFTSPANVSNKMRFRLLYTKIKH